MKLWSTSNFQRNYFFFLQVIISYLEPLVGWSLEACAKNNGVKWV